MRGSGGARGTEEPSAGQKQRAPILGGTASPRVPQPRKWGSPTRWHCWDSCKKKGFLRAFLFRSSIFIIFFYLFFSPYLVSEEFILVEN